MGTYTVTVSNGRRLPGYPGLYNPTRSKEAGYYADPSNNEPVPQNFLWPAHTFGTKVRSRGETACEHGGERRAYRPPLTHPLASTHCCQCPCPHAYRLMRRSHVHHVTSPQKIQLSTTSWVGYRYDRYYRKSN